MTDRPDDLPDRPMTLKELCDFYAPLQRTLISEANGTKQANLRLIPQRRLQEGFHAFLFGDYFGF